MDQVGERLAQQQRVARHLRVGELEAEVDLLRHRAVHPFVGRVLDHRAQVDAARPRPARCRRARRAPARAAGWRGARCGSSRGAPAPAARGCPRARPARARFRCAPAGRRAACAAGARRWRGSAAGCCSTSATWPNSWFSALTSGRASSGACAGIDRPQVARRARADLVRQVLQRREAALDAEPDQIASVASVISSSGTRLESTMLRASLRALVGGLGDLHGADLRRRRAPAARRRGSAGRGRRRRRRSRRPPACAPAGTGGSPGSPASVEPSGRRSW